MRMKRILISVIMACFIAGLASPALSCKWTFMVYLDADNNLEDAGIDDFLEMSSVGSTSNVNIVVQFDRISGYDNRYDNWTTCKRFYVTEGMTPEAANAVKDIGEVNMGSPATLQAFIDWGTSNYPACHYALVLWNHGSGWRQMHEALIKSLKMAKTGAEREQVELALKELERPNYKAVCFDDTSMDALYTKEVQSALNGATDDVDLVGFDACLMGMIEVAYEVKDTGASVMVGSEETEPWDGWPYHTILDDLVANHSWTPGALGTAIVERYYESYGNSETQSAIDLSCMDALADAVSTLADTTIAYWDMDRAAVQAAAQDVMTEVDNAVIHEQHGSSLAGSHGLAIYFPSTEWAFDPDYNGTIIDFPADTSWEEFLGEFYATMETSWIASARSDTQGYYEQGHIDLYDFCDHLVHAPEPCDIGYMFEVSSFSFEDIRSTGTDLILYDDDYADFSLPFTFSFYCQDYNEVTVSSNGTVYFVQRLQSWSNACIPSADAYGVDTFIAPFWDDLNPEAGGAVHYEIRGTEPERRLIVQWTNVPQFPSTGAVTLQAILYEGTNEILFQYLDVEFGDVEYDNGASATVGVQEDLVSGTSYSCNTASLADGLALLFTPVTGITKEKLMITREKSDGKYKLQIYNLPSTTDGNTGPAIASDDDIGKRVMEVAGGNCDLIDGDELIMMRLSSSGDKRLYVYRTPPGVHGNISDPIATDSNIGNSSEYLIAGNFDQDADSEIAVVRKGGTGRFRLYIYDMPTTVGGDIGAAVASDTDIGKRVRGIAAANYDSDPQDELFVLQKLKSGKYRLSIYNAPTAVGGSIGPRIASDNDIGERIIECGIAAGNLDNDPLSEVAIVRKDSSGQHKLLIYDAPEVVGGDTGGAIASDKNIGKNVRAVAACDYR
jgi:hypothetical protein